MITAAPTIIPVGVEKKGFATVGVGAGGGNAVLIAPDAAAVPLVIAWPASDPAALPNAFARESQKLRATGGVVAAGVVVVVAMVFLNLFPGEFEEIETAKNHG